MDNRKQEWYYHLALLATIVVMNMLRYSILDTPNGLFSKLHYPYFLYLISFYTVFCSVYFLNYFLVCPRTIAKKRIPQFVLSVILLFLVYSGFRYFLDEVLLFNITGIHNYFEGSRSFGYYVMDNSYYAIKAILLSTVFYLLVQFIENRNKMHLLQLEHKKAELSLLKTQLEPHFLFNTLNTFYTDLVDTQPETAKDIHRLSQLLRYITYETQRDFALLSKEIQFVTDYIYFQRKRFEDCLFLDYKVEGIIGNQTIPSLVLIHFVENIFKHGILNDKEVPAKLTINVSRKEVLLTTENKISTSEKYSKKGIGEANLKQRLKAIYGNDFQLTFSKIGTSFESRLVIPFDS